MTKTRPCSLCRQRPRSTHVIGPDLCDPCHEYAGWENTHSDEGHDQYDGTNFLTDDNCPICNDVPPPWETPIKEPEMTKTAAKRTRKATKRTNPSTRHFSHANCSHPRNPAGRAACRKAMRAPVTERVEDDGVPVTVEPDPVADMRLEDDAVRIHRKDARNHRGDTVRVTTSNDQVFTGQLVSWGPQVLTLVPDADTQAWLGRTWKREAVATAAIRQVTVV